MSEEEKKAIVELNNYSNMTAYWKQEEYTNSEIDYYIHTLLNLIEKQQKEIEFYKKQELGYIAGYQDGKNHKQTAISLKVENTQQELFQREIERYKEKIEQQQKEIEILREENFDTVYIQAVADFKDKIREKIEEIDNFEIGKISREEYNRIEFATEVLLELLEE